jgi:hypothetical protein
MTYAKAHGKRYDEAYSTWLERMVRKAEAAPINCNSCGDWFQPKTPGETECSSSCYADIRGIGDHEDEPPPAAEEDDEGEDDNDE